jgi:chitinase
MTDIQEGLDLLWRNDIDPDKVVFGMSYYSRSFQLANPGCSEPKCIVASAGEAGTCSNTVGVLLHAEIQDIIKEKKLTPKLYKDEAVKTIHWDNQWVSFDDVATWRLKGNNIRSQCIKSVMVWAISQDDNQGTNSKALLSALGRKVMAMPDFTEAPPQQQVPQPISLCRWANCGENCPAGFKTVPRDGTDLMMTDDTHCPMNPGTQSLFCCPSDWTLPTCTWRGHRNSGYCKAGCSDGEVEVGTLKVGCKKSHQSACCVDSAPVKAYGSCKWYLFPFQVDVVLLTVILGTAKPVNVQEVADTHPVAINIRTS